jgi:hypothetical protein
MVKLFCGVLGATLTVLGVCLSEIALAEDTGTNSKAGFNSAFTNPLDSNIQPDSSLRSDLLIEANDPLKHNMLDPEETEEETPLDQVTSVSQLTDVQPTDWAFQALQSLIERYGCIVGYPDGTYKGNRTLSRYEFAAGVNACLDRVNELIAAGTTGLATKEDLATLQKLQEEFAAELATLRGQVDALEARTTELEANQFSTTTKMSGELITFLADAYGENAGPENNPAFGYRLRFDFDTSFTGKDRFRTRFQSTNLRRYDSATEFPAGPLSGPTDETRFLATSVGSNGDITLHRLQYRFPVGDRLLVYIDANSIDPSIITDPITPFNDQATGSVSNFAQINPIWFPIGNQAGLGANLVISPSFQLDFGYEGELEPNNPSVGFFNGGYSAFAHFIYKTNNLKASFFYINSYSPNFGIDTLAGSNASKVIQLTDPGSFSNPVIGNGYGLQFDYRLSPGFGLGGWLGYSAARALGDIKGDASVWNFALNLAFPDLGKKGSLGGFVFGMQPRLTGTSSNELAAAIGLPFENGRQRRSDRDVGFHIEAFYRYQITDSISITPGIIWLTAPNHDARNPDVVIGVLRTTFLF